MAALMRLCAPTEHQEMLILLLLLLLLPQVLSTAYPAAAVFS